jgi:hypothetical protein
MIPQPVRRSYIQGRGWTWTQAWIGPKALAFGLEQQLIAAHYDVATREDGPMATVEATFGGRDDIAGSDEVVEDQWELTFNIVEKELYDHPSISALATVEVGDEDLLSQLRRAVEEKSLRNVDPDVSPEDYATFYEAYNLALSGTTSIIVEQAVLRHTRTVSARFERSAAMTNVGKIVTKAQMSGNEGAPAEIVIEESNPEGLPYPTVFGYRKAKPSITRTAGNKWHIVNEYVSGIWSTLLYQSATY